MGRNGIEIMAPVGSFESLQAAIQAGANSIYFGIDRLNMRAHSANNFTADDVHKVVETCHIQGLKAYLTLNTVMYEEDLEQVKVIVRQAKEVGVDAIIASDIAVMQCCNEQGVPVHLSTQLNISNTSALKFYAQFADVAVLARENNLEQVRSIHDTIVKEHICGRNGQPMRLEMFCHGALCMAVSGKCYLSLHNHNKSANRGECMQVCRRQYVVKDKSSDIELEVDNEYIMSPKDLKTIHFLNKILDAGVEVLKIEGRARGPEYVYTTVKCYREAVEVYERGEWDSPTIVQRIVEWDTRLATVFNRGFWDGYYLGQRLGEWTHTYGSLATKKKVYVGRCTNFFKNISVLELFVEAVEKIEVGDEVLVIGDTTGVVNCTITQLNDELGSPEQQALKGHYCAIKTPTLCRRGDKIYVLK